MDNSTSAIKKFYSNRSILITGVTGFVGKVLLEKILRAFPDVNKVYILVRPKKDLSIEERVQKLLQSPVFSFIPHSQEQLAKVIPIAGNVSTLHMDLSEGDRKMLQDDVSVVIHAAASIRFDSQLSEHLQTNVLGTKYLLQLCRGMKNLSCLVFCSTAFSNCQLKDVDEKLYPLKYNPNDVLKLHEVLDSKTLETLVPDLIEGRPNTYVYSKALAEHVVCSEMEGFTVAITRPAIVGPTVAEPVKGWVDSLHGPAGLSILAGLGIIQAIDWEPEVKPDAIAVDHLCNALIASAWHMHTYSPNQHKIFNLTSSNLRPMSAFQFMTHARKASLKYPSLYMVRPLMYPPKGRTNPTLYKLRKFFYHILFAYFIDFFLGLAGREKLMLRVVNKMHHALKLTHYFMVRDWNFTSNNFIRLIDDLEGHDSIEFNPDMRKVEDEVQAIEDLWLGCRRFILKENDKTIDLAHKKYVAMCCAYKIYQMFLIFLLYKFLFVWTPIAMFTYQSMTFLGRNIFPASLQTFNSSF